MTSKQRAYLRGLAMNLQPIQHFGKGGVTENAIIQLDQALEAHELVKVQINSNADTSAKAMLDDLAIRTRSEAVQAIGGKVTLYRVSHKEGIKHIVLPK